MPHKSGTGAIRGIVSEDGIPAQKRVTLLDRTNFRRLSTIVSGEDGDYAFSGLDPATDDYMVFAVDDDKGVGENYKDPIIYDRVQPVNVAIGVRQYNEWFYLAQSQGLIASYIPITASPSGNPNSISSGSGFAASAWSLLGPNQIDGRYASTTPGSPSLGNVQLDNTLAMCYAAPSTQANRTTTLSPITLEWVLDTSDVTGNPAIYLLPRNYPGRTSAQAIVGTDGLSNGQYDYGVNAYIGYIPNRRVIQIGYNGVGSNNYCLGAPFSRCISNVLSEYTSSVLEYTLPAELVGTTLHIMAQVCVASSSLYSKIFINGVKVAEKYLTKEGRYAYDEKGNVQLFMIGGSAVTGKALTNTGMVFQDFTNACLKTSLAAVYFNKFFADQEVLQHYNALFKPNRTPATPVDSGYYYAVKLRRPSIFFPLNEILAENGSLTVYDNAVLKWALSRTGVGTAITPASSSIVLGRTILNFEGTALLSSTSLLPAFAPAYEGITMAFVAAPARATPSSTETLFKYTSRTRVGTSSSYLAQNWGVERTVAGKFQIKYGSTIAFETLPELNVQHLYCFTLDQVNGKARMYVDGTLVEEQTVAITLMQQFGTQAYHYQYSEGNVVGIVAIGGDYVSNGSSESAAIDATAYYKGAFGVFSAHPYVMSDEEIEDLYDYLDVL